MIRRNISNLIMKIYAAIFKKRYVGNIPYYEKRLDKVMKRLYVDAYGFDWVQGRKNSSCWVELTINNRQYRFENSSETLNEKGEALNCASDLLASIVYTLEAVAEIVL